VLEEDLMIVSPEGCVIRRYYTQELEFIESWEVSDRFVGLAGHSDRDVTDVQVYGPQLPGFRNAVGWARKRFQ